jgi:hypothetical protein
MQWNGKHLSVTISANVSWLCQVCLKFVFPSEDDITLKASDVLTLVDKNWFDSLSGVQEGVMKWFKDYLIEVEQKQGAGILL